MVAHHPSAGAAFSVLLVPLASILVPLVPDTCLQRMPEGMQRRKAMATGGGGKFIFGAGLVLGLAAGRYVWGTSAETDRAHDKQTIEEKLEKLETKVKEMRSAEEGAAKRGRRHIEQFSEVADDSIEQVKERVVLKKGFLYNPDTGELVPMTRPARKSRGQWLPRKPIERDVHEGTDDDVALTEDREDDN